MNAASLLDVIRTGPARTGAELCAALRVPRNTLYVEINRLKAAGVIEKAHILGAFRFVLVDAAARYERLLANVLARTDEVGDCAIWRDSVAKDTGYPSMRHQGRCMRVQNALWRAAGKDHPPEKRLVMKCGDKRCVLPGHMVLVDRAVACQMAAAAGSYRSLTKGAKISATQRAKYGLFTDEQALALRLSEKSNAALAAEHGCCRATIGQLRRGETYKPYGSPFAGLGARA